MSITTVLKATLAATIGILAASVAISGGRALYTAIKGS